MLSSPPAVSDSDDSGRFCMNGRTIALVGLMGSGKTSVGRALARRLGCDFLDCDRELEQRLGVVVATIFDIEGESGFRQRETRLLRDLLLSDKEAPARILATGGGVVLAAENRALLKAHCTVLYLNVAPNHLWRRTRLDRKRPLLQVDNPREVLERLYQERDPLYREVADAVVEGGRGNLQNMVQKTLLKLEPLLAASTDEKTQ